MSSTEQGITSTSASGASGLADQFNQFMNVALQISGTNAGPTVNVYLKSKSGIYPVAWSLGDESDDSNGLQISLNTSGTLPLTQVSITPTQATFYTGSGGGGGNQWSFVVQCFLAGEEGLTGFDMWVGTDPSIAVTASLNNGRQHVLNGAPSHFDWEPIG